MEYILDTNDYVGVSFWIATAVMATGALFFFMERSTVKPAWQTSLTVAALVCFVAFLALSIYERRLGSNRRITNSVQIH